MEYPLISEYRDAILSAEDNFNELSSLRPVLDSNGNPVMSSGNFAVVFKMRDEKNGKFYAVKCFIKEQEGRNESYRKIADELEGITSPYVVTMRYIEDELFVDSAQCECEEFPVVLMEWVDGEPLDACLKRKINDRYELEMLSYRFNQMAAWLLTQPFAHGDIKPDNILVREDGTLVLVDYDGMFVPSMKGEKAREIGSPDYRHSLRAEEDFNEHIDDFSISVIALSLKAIALKPELRKNLTADTLLFTERDFRDPSMSDILRGIQTLAADSELSLLLGAFFIALAKNSLDLLSFKTFVTAKPKRPIISEAVKADTSVTEEDIANGVKDEFGVVYSKDGKRLLRSSHGLENYNIKEGTEIICDKAFYLCSSLQSVDIPSSVTSLGDEAFMWCDSLQSVYIPSSVTTIGDSAFYGCSSLENLNLPASVKALECNPFIGCPKLQLSISEKSDFVLINGLLIDKSGRIISCLNHSSTIEIPTSVTSIGDRAFCGCHLLQSVEIPTSVTSIGHDAFESCDSLARVEIPSSVTSIGDSAFCKCHSLQSVEIPTSVTFIGHSAFESCDSLARVEIPSSVTSIGDSAFWGCHSLQNVDIPTSVTTIGDRAFCKCHSLQSVEIPTSVTSIGDSAFWGCHSLQNVDIPTSVTSIGDNAFSGCSSLRVLNLPASVKALGCNPFIGCPKLQLSISEKSDFVLINGLLINKSGRIISCLNHSSTIEIPTSVTSIGDSAFWGCRSLQSVDIPSSVTAIGNRAFSDCCSLLNVEIPTSVTSIRDEAFSDCYSLQNVDIPSSVTAIGNGAFFYCRSLVCVDIPTSVTSIGDEAFMWCDSLQSVYIPTSVISIGENAFYGCRSLERAIIHGTRIVDESKIFPSECTVIYEP